MLKFNPSHPSVSLSKAAAALVAFCITAGMTVVVQAQTLTIYSGRSKNLIQPLLDQAKTELGIDIQVRYGDTAELAISLLEEGKNSKADLFFAQDAGALGTLEKQGRTVTLPSTILDQVSPQFRSPQGGWIGISGRARVINYNTKMVSASELPRSIADLTQPKWRGKVAWAPTNGSFQSFITAMRQMEGDAKTLQWLKDMKSNGTKIYANNTAIVQALGRGEVAIGLVNNYYLPNLLKTQPNIPVASHYTDRDAGSMINVAGVAVMNSTKQQSLVERFVSYLLRPTSQAYFAKVTNEYPLRKDTPGPTGQPPLAQINSPDINLSNLADLAGTLKLLQQAEIL
jgi:iron(III) transport system substrate-binding protein